MSYRGKRIIDQTTLRQLVKDSTSKHEVMKALGIPLTGTYGYGVLNHYLEEFAIDVSHFKGRSAGSARTQFPLQDILDGQHPQYNAFRLKNRMIKEGLFEHVCSSCALTEWMGKPIPLDIDHINGKPNDHRRANLRLLCRNCHAQTDTFCGKNKGK